MEVDEAFKDDLKRMYNDLEKPIVYDDLLSTEQARAQTLRGLLGGSVRNRALQIVKRVEKRDGFEAKGEVTSSQLQSIQTQVLKLEELFVEAEKAGTEVQEELKSAIRLKYVSGQLTEKRSYKDIRGKWTYAFGSAPG